MLRRVRRAMAFTTLCVAMVCVSAGPVRAEVGDPDPGGGNATTSTTLDTNPVIDPPSDSSTTTTTTPTDPSSTTTTTAPADNDSGATTTSSSTTTTTTGPGSSTTRTSIPSSGGSGRSNKDTHPSSSTTTTAPGSTSTTAPAPSPAGAVVTNDSAGDASAAGDAGASGGSTSSGGSGRSTHPSPTRPDKNTDAAAAPPPPDPLSFPGGTPVPPGFDASGLGGLFGVVPGAAQVPAGVTPDLALTDSEYALPSRDHNSSSSSVALLGVSLLILLALAAGTAYRWWDRRSDRYWPA